MERDFFICHASEDKSSIVRPLTNAFQKEGIACWIDEGEIQWGDSITQKVNDGLKISRYVIVVLSTSFMSKNWPKRELFAALNQEASSGEVKVLPLLVGDKVNRDNILRELPLLGDKMYITWDKSPEDVVKAARSRLSTSQVTPKGVVPSGQRVTDVEDIPLPRIRKRFTQRDRDLLLTETYRVTKEYFQRALLRLKDQYTEVDTDLTEIHATKFIAKIYYQGDIKSQSKVWIDGFSSSDGIKYSENRFSIDSDNSFNELIVIEDDGLELKIKMMFGLIGQQPTKAPTTPLEAAEALWKRFSAPLTYL